MMSAAAVTRGLCLWCLILSVAACGGRTPLLPPSCQMSVDLPALDFGEVSPNQSVVRQVTIANHGRAVCKVTGIGVGESTDAWFSLLPDTPTSLVVEPSTYELVGVTFLPTKASVPLVRTGVLVFETNDSGRGHVGIPLTARIGSNCALEISPQSVDFGPVKPGSSTTNAVGLTNLGDGPSLAFTSTDPKHMTATVPLSADIDVGCQPTWTPPSLDFGSVVLNSRASASISLGNDGNAVCLVSSLGLALDSDPNFTLDAGPTPAFAIAPESSQAVRITFAAADSVPPHLKTGTLTWQTGSTQVPSAAVPLSARVDTVCVEASRWIYTVDDSSMLSRFDPDSLTFTDIG